MKTIKEILTEGTASEDLKNTSEGILTPKQIERIEHEYSGKSYAGEKVKAEMIKGYLYIYGSELACLRMFYKFHAEKGRQFADGRVGYSTNLKTWYYERKWKTF